MNRGLIRAQYGLIKRLEHFFKGLSGPESQISAVPPERYGDRFVRFITGVTKSRELVEQQTLQRNLEAVAAAAAAQTSDAAENESSSRPTSQVLPSLHRKQEMTKTDAVMERAERSAERSTRHGGSEANVPDRQLGTVRSPPTDPDGSYTLPVVEEAAESGSTGGRSRDSAGGVSSVNGVSRSSSRVPVDLANTGKPVDPLTAMEGGQQQQQPPPTPPKDGRFVDGVSRPYAKRDGPPTPPTESEKAGRDLTTKELPPVPAARLQSM
jgi:1-phosphatidylinositol-4-phosphate 5-kinase